jgi:UDP-N-acetylglucosamine acyltransferase
MSKIYPTAVVSPDVIIGDGVSIGPYSIINGDVKIGDRCEIGAHTFIGRWTDIDKDCKIFQNVVIGNPPQDVKFKGKRSYVRVGERNIIREFVTIHRGSGEDEETRIGNDNFLMAYVHIAHNVKLGNNIIIANGSQLSGFVEVEDFAFISGLCPIHQFVRIGCHSMIGGGYRVPKDVIPYSLCAGEPLRPKGLNIVGLRRHGFTAETIEILKQAFNILLFSRLNTTQAVDELKKLPQIKEVKHLIDFIIKSKRGIAK